MRDLTNEQIGLIASKVMEINRKQHEAQEKQEKDRRLRNTKLLLRNYHSFKKYIARTKMDLWEDEGVSEIRTLVLNGEDLVKSIKESTQRTLVMIRHLDRALEALRFICKQEESNKSSAKQYRILRARFLDGESIETIAERECINERSVYKSIDAAAERLSILLFGVYGIEIN
ncbi:MAG: hypothetical protein ABS896_09335 [Carnobacterium inhibens]|uniref:hypothetical protein n=1 Tax=Carnobacterium inhibens TaxID=147709 RepID=UPI003314A737